MSDDVVAITQRSDLVGVDDPAVLHAEIERLETLIRVTATHEDKTAMVISLMRIDGKPEPSVQIVVSGPAYRDDVLVEAGTAAMKLYLEIYRSLEMERLKAIGRQARQTLRTPKRDGPHGDA